MIERAAYWLRSALAIPRRAARPWALLPLLWGRPVMLRVRSGPLLELGHLLDLLIWKEIWIDDEYALGSLERPACVIDVGAGIGLFSAAVATRYPQCELVVAEPDPRQLRALRRNLASAGATRARVHGRAVATRPVVRLHPGAAPPRTSTAFADHGKGRCIEVAAVPLRQLVSESDEPVDLLKIDCEGAERDVLESLDDAAWACLRRIAVEVHGAGRPGLGAAIESLLVERGFAVERSRERAGTFLLHARRVVPEPRPLP